jgi:polyphosphate kinase
MGDTHAGPVVAPEHYINRELSWIAFNYRVLAQALDERTPPLEQAKFSAIFSNNLDEFFMVRVASLKSQIEAGVAKLSDDGLTPLEQLTAIQSRLRPLLELQQQHYRHSLKSNLAEYGVQLIDYASLNAQQRQWVDHYFQTAVFPVLTPLAVDPAHPFPFVSNLSLNVAALVRDPQTGQQQFARVKVPQKILPRFRVTRDADLELRDLEADDLMEALEEGLRKRRRGGEVVRLEVADEMPEAVVQQLMEGMGVEPEDVYRINGPLGLDDLMGLMALPLPQLKDKPFKGRTHPGLARAQRSQLEEGSIKAEEFQSIFSVIRRGDVLLQHPYDLFATSVEEFLNQAADDPAVLAIKMTLYRTSKDSPVVAALIRAAENGKQVMALVELKARFDEDNNIQWAKQLESSGVHVVYGVLGLKTHTKILLVVRREKDRLNTYVHLGTGNYNSKTSSLYTDLGLLTANPAFGADLVELFNYLTGFSKQQSFRKLLVAPVTLRKRMEELIRREIAHAREGRGGQIRAKMNALVDPAIIALLYEAAQAGVRIELVVRGMCSLRPGLEGVSNTITVVSVIGRFLEHSRMFWFANAGAPEAYIGSADWMPRNLDRRVEAVAPVEEPHLREQLEQLLDLYLHDTSAWHMASDGQFHQQHLEVEEQLTQRELMARWRGGLMGATS